MVAGVDGRPVTVALTRRALLATGAAALARPAQATSPTLALTRRTLPIGGRAAPALAIAWEGPGIPLVAGQRFHPTVRNDLDEASLVHWHGQTPPSDQDGVPGLSQPELAPGGSYAYDFVLRAGTHWMHAHVGLQEQHLLAAPMVVLRPGEEAEDVQQVVVMLHDYTFRDPAEVLAELMSGGGAHAGHVGHGIALNDVEHDAYLANDRTLDDPEVVAVERGGRVKLRLINGSAATNVWIDLGGLNGRLVAVDGNDVVPLPGRRFPLAIAQRADILIDLPPGAGAWPIVALREGGPQRSGIVLATTGATVARLTTAADEIAPALTQDLETSLRAATAPAAGTPDRALTLDLGGGGADYAWTLNGALHGMDTPLEVRAGERIELAFRNTTSMAHPMHLHGHHFQVLGIGGARFLGAIRDTVLVPAGGTVSVGFAADNPGHWALHCHNLYHMVAGMMTSVRYVG